MSNGSEKLTEWIARLGELESLAADSAPDIAAALKENVAANIEAGKGPDGKPWPLTQQGKVPLRNAAKALNVRAIGSVIVARLTGIEAKHHFGAVRGGMKRQILPTTKVPGPVLDAIQSIVSRRFKKAIGGK